MTISNSTNTMNKTLKNVLLKLLEVIFGWLISTGKEPIDKAKDKNK